jgi:hypothetical protein
MNWSKVKFTNIYQNKTLNDEMTREIVSFLIYNIIYANTVSVNDIHWTVGHYRDFGAQVTI